MTREERIARSNQAVTDTFATGAQWANGYSEFEMVNKQKFIDKACEWLRANTQIYAYQMYDTDLVRMIEDFRKDMEE